MFSMIVNFDLEPERRTLWEHFRSLRGHHKIEIKRAGHSRTLKQNALYHGVYIPAIKRHFAEQGEVFSHLILHEMLKAKFLKSPVFNEATGTIIGERVKSTTELDTREFSEYLENVKLYSLETYGIVLPEAERQETA